MLNKISLLTRRSTRFYSAPSNVKKLGIVGAGQMGSGIAKVGITSNIEVVIVDNNEKGLNKAVTGIEQLLQRDVEKQRMDKDGASAARSRLKASSSLKDLAGSDFVIEAVSENENLKFSILSELDKIVGENTILASNTSSISITKLASKTSRADRVIGMHFMNPVPVMKLVEIISGIQTSASTKERTLALAREMGKTTTESADIAGFIANRLLCPYINEAFLALQTGLGTAEAIDTTMKLGTNMPMGPLALADFIGLDTVLAIMNVIHAELGDKYKPAPLLVRYVEAGWYGKKVGRGVYTY
eukprot:TRINITY_DN1554_c0_g1_i1.p1 TRINITY_DN1554_c0_g1~~TRINITY_DN1554_c0_g1_i1.p1  ORF type:complete len:301 (-),score=75.96 TRINITY_DN1554_c0_g1_i1:25-927(-)